MIGYVEFTCARCHIFLHALHSQRLTLLDVVHFQALPCCCLKGSGGINSGTVIGIHVNRYSIYIYIYICVYIYM